MEAVRAPGDAHGWTIDGGGTCWVPDASVKLDDVGVAGYGWAGDCCGVIDVDGVPLEGSGGDLRGLQ